MNPVTSFVQNTVTIGRAVVGTVASAGSATVGTVASHADGPHWIQQAAWGGAAFAGVLTGLGVAVKIYIDIRASLSKKE